LERSHFPQSRQQRSRQPRRSVLPPDIRPLGCPLGVAEW
jgi:hypothetical protein